MQRQLFLNSLNKYITRYCSAILQIQKGGNKENISSDQWPITYQVYQTTIIISAWLPGSAHTYFFILFYFLYIHKKYFINILIYAYIHTYSGCCKLQN